MNISVWILGGEVERTTVARYTLRQIRNQRIHDIYERRFRHISRAYYTEAIISQYEYESETVQINFNMLHLHRTLYTLYFIRIIFFIIFFFFFFFFFFL